MRWERVTGWLGGYPLVVLSVALATAVCLPFRTSLPPQAFMLMFVPVIVGLATLLGTRASAFAAVLSMVAIDFFLIRPFHTLTIASPTEWIALIVFLVIALVSGHQTGRLRERQVAAVHRQEELALLNRLSLKVAGADSVREIVEFIVVRVVAVLGTPRAALFLAAGDPRAPFASAGAAASSDEARFVEWVLRNNKAIGLPAMPDPLAERPIGVGRTEALPGTVADGAYVPLQTTGRLEGVLYARSGTEADLTTEDARFLVAVANLASAVIERDRLEDAAAHAGALKETDRLKSMLVASVSHELKTPLAAATARVTGLVEEGAGADPDRVHAELLEVAEDLGRLNASIADLLDLSRLESDAWRPRFEEHDISDVLGTALSRLPASRRSRVRFRLTEGVPPVRMDFDQMTRALGNLVENALEYSEASDEVLVRSEVVADAVLVTVEDAGPGIPDEEKDFVFDKFYRGRAGVAAPGGTGLGLAICREIVRGHGGSVWVEDVQPHGARIVVRLPLGAGPADEGAPHADA